MKPAMKPLWIGAVIAAFLVSLASLSACRREEAKKTDTAPVAANSAPPAAPAPAASGIKLELPPLPERRALDKEAKFSLIYTTSVSGALIDCGCPKHLRGGLARRVKWVEDKKRSGKPVLQLDAGNLFFPHGRMGVTVDEPARKRARVLARAMNKIKIDALNVGGQDLAGGLGLLKELAGSGRESLPILSANLRERAGGEPIFPAYRLVEIAGARVGVFGLIDPAQLAGSSLFADDPAQTAARVAGHLKPHCDLVVLLWAGRAASASAIVKAAPGIDIIIAAGQGGSPSDRPLAMGDSILTQAGNRGMFLGGLELTLYPETRPKAPEEQKAKLRERLALLEARKSVLSGTIQSDPQAKAEYQKIHAEAEDIRANLLAPSSTLDYAPQMISVEIDLPEDPETAEWVKEAQ